MWKEKELQWTDEEVLRLGAITDRAQIGSETICEWCGSPGALREDRNYVLTLCGYCNDRFSNPPVPHPRRYPPRAVE